MEKRVVKSIGAISVIAAMGSMVVGCGSSGGTGDSGNSTNTASGKASGGKVVNIITWQNGPTVNVLKKIDKEFEQKYGIKANLQTAPNTDAGYATMEQTAIQSGNADIMSIFPFEPMPKTKTASTLTKTQNWVVHGVFAKLDNQPWVNKYSKSLLKGVSYNGHLYGLETGVYQSGVFYNKDIFSKYKLSPPKTYNQLLHVAKVLKSHNVTPFWLGLQNVGPGYLQFLLYPLMKPWASQVGALNQSLPSGKAKWTDSQFVTAMTREKQLAKYLEPNYTGEPWQQMPGSFASGKAAMLLDGSWDLAAVQKANPKMNIGYFPLPGSNSNTQSKSIVDPNMTLVLLNNSKHKTAAEKWLTFFSSPKIYAQYVNATGISPSQTSGTYNSVASKAMGKYFGNGMSQTMVKPQFPANGPFYLQSKNFWALQLDVVQGKKTPKQAAQLLQKDQKKMSK